MSDITSSCHDLDLQLIHSPRYVSAAHRLLHMSEASSHLSHGRLHLTWYTCYHLLVAARLVTCCMLSRCCISSVMRLHLWACIHTCITCGMHHCVLPQCDCRAADQIKLSWHLHKALPSTEVWNGGHQQVPEPQARQPWKVRASFVGSGHTPVISAQGFVLTSSVVNE